MLVDCNSEKRSACDARADHGSVANTRDSPAIAVCCCKPSLALVRLAHVLHFAFHCYSPLASVAIIFLYRSRL